jgi:hypothetical protein
VLPLRFCSLDICHIEFGLKLRDETIPDSGQGFWLAQSSSQLGAFVLHRLQSSLAQLRTQSCLLPCSGMLLSCKALFLSLLLPFLVKLCAYASCLLDTLFRFFNLRQLQLQPLLFSRNDGLDGNQVLLLSRRDCGRAGFCLIACLLRMLFAQPCKQCTNSVDNKVL